MHGLSASRPHPMLKRTTLVDETAARLQTEVERVNICELDVPGILTTDIAVLSRNGKRIIDDIGMKVAKEYGMIHPNASNTSAVRAVFFIDPESKIRAIIYYPLTNGRNFQELKRLLIAMQTSDKYGVATPADWQPGDEVIVPAPKTSQEACQRVAQSQDESGQDYRTVDWYLSFKPAPSS